MSDDPLLSGCFVGLAISCVLVGCMLALIALFTDTRHAHALAIAGLVLDVPGVPAGVLLFRDARRLGKWSR